jgi:hypothetical protein
MLVAEECWDDAPRHTPLEEMSGRGVPKRVNRGVFGEATLAYHERKGLLEGGRRERRLLVPSGAQPGPRARAASIPATAPGSVRPGAPRGLCPLCPVGHGPAGAGGRCPRPAAASLPVGAAHKHRSSADTCGLSSVVPRPAGSALPADSARWAVLGGAGDGCARRPATGASECARRRTGSHRDGGVTCSRRPASH